MPRPARLLVLLAFLLALAPGTASATHWQGDASADDPPAEEQPYVEEEDDWGPPADTPAPEQPPVVAEPQHRPPEDFDALDGTPWDDGGRDRPVEPEIPLVTTPTVAGRQAMLRTNGKAAIPRGAPKRVRAIIAAGNQIAGKPYKWGGGHARLVDRGYDCSGAVGYALIRSGFQTAPMVSGTYKRWGVAGAGKWVTVYANKGHVYLEVAGLRLDTSAAGYGRSGVRWRPVTGRRRGFTARHPAGL